MKALAEDSTAGVPEAEASLSVHDAACEQPVYFEIGTEPSGRSFLCAPGETILKAGLVAGLAISYECASGSCGTCRARLLEGEVESHWPDAPGLSARDRAKGDRILCCQAMPKTACRIQVAHNTSTVTPAPRRWVAVLAERIDLKRNVLRLSLQVDAPCDFLAGQFMMFQLPGVGRRAYSMSNRPDGSGRLDFIVKAKPGGCATALLFSGLAEGDALMLEGPYGHAHWRDSGERTVVGLAGGSGLGPVWSVLQAALHSGTRQPVHLFFGVNEADDLFLTEEFKALAAHFPQLQVQRVLMRAGASDPADCVIGTLSEVALRCLGDLNKCDVYMAGPPAMIDAALKDTVMVGRACADRVYFDRFC